MATLLQCIEQLIKNIEVTDKQEENIKNSLTNIVEHLKDKDNNLYLDKSFVTGSYERDTIIRPLKDIDLFAVLKRDGWKDENGNLLNPQSVLTKIKNYLDSLNDYKGKVKQDRPCVTIELSDKDFDILPSFEQQDGVYLIPNHDLKTWTFSNPEQLTKNLNDVHQSRARRVKQVVKVAKYWKRENCEFIPSYHIEEIAIGIFQTQDFKNFEEAIRLWFNNAEFYLASGKFKSNDDFTVALSKIKKVKEKLDIASAKYSDGKEGESIKIWKDIFGKEFPTVDTEEAKNISKSLSEGSLKISSTGLLSATIGRPVTPSKGFYGNESNDKTS